MMVTPDMRETVRHREMETRGRGCLHQTAALGLTGSAGYVHLVYLCATKLFHFTTQSLRAVPSAKSLQPASSTHP